MNFTQLFSQLVVFFSKLSKPQKLIIAGAVIGVVAFLIFLVVFSSPKSKDNRYITLFDSLSSSDAAKVVEQLEKNDIPYKLQNGNAIKVPKDEVHKQRITMASMGIPKDGGVGFELFDKQEFGATSFDQNVKYHRALEGELSRTINALAPINSAVVSLAIPKSSLFIEKQIEASASVMIEIIEGRRLSSKQIRGIKNLISSAVPKMKSSSVMLVNSDGETLGDEDEMTQMGELSLTQQKYKTKEEKKREKKIIEVISPFVGGEKKVVAKVTIDFDFSIKNSTSESFDPENVVRSEQVSEEKREGSTPKEIGGVPGTVSNIGPVKGLKGNQRVEKYEKNTGTTNYEIGKTVATTKSQFARIKKISAAVIVDGKYNYKLDEEGEQTDALEYKSIEESDLEALTSLASRSVGIDQARGDEISVRNLQFKRSKEIVVDNMAFKIAKISAEYVEPFSGLFKYVFVVILLLILYRKVIVPFASRMLEISKEDEELDRPELDLDDDEEEDLVEKVQAMRKKVENQLGVGEGFNEDELKHEVLLEKVRTMTEDAPEEIAMLLQSLLTEEEEQTGKGR